MGRRRGHGEGAIYPRSRDGRWVAVLDLGYVGGKRVRRSFTARTRKEAQQRLREAQQAHDAGLVTSKPPKVGEFLRTWLEEVVEPGSLAEKTKVFYAGTCRLHLIPVLGDLRLDKLSARDVHRLLTSKRADGLGDRSLQAMHATLRRSLAVAVQWGLVTHNVAMNIDAPRPTRDTSRVHALDREAIQALISASASVRLGAMIPVLLMTGIRKGELLALTWADIDFEAGSMIIARSAYRSRGTGMTTKAPKTDRTRTISLPRQAIDQLREQRQAQRRLRLAAGPLWCDNDLVFSTDIGNLLDEKIPNTVLRRACLKAGLPHERVHNLRHSAAMTAASATNGDLHAVKDLLGHASISTTFDTYGHRMTESQERLGRAMSDWFDAPHPRAAER